MELNKPQSWEEWRDCHHTRYPELLKRSSAITEADVPAWSRPSPPVRLLSSLCIYMHMVFCCFFVFFPCFVRILMILLNGCLWVLQKLKSSTSSAILVSYFFCFQGYFDFDFDFYGTCYSFFSLWVFLIASFSLWCFLWLSTVYDCAEYFSDYSIFWLVLWGVFWFSTVECFSD